MQRQNRELDERIRRMQEELLPQAVADNAHSQQDLDAAQAQLAVTRGFSEKERLRAVRWQQACASLQDEAEVRYSWLNELWRVDWKFVFLFWRESRKFVVFKGKEATFCENRKGV
jgi:SHS2 domain-containing protein